MHACIYRCVQTQLAKPHTGDVVGAKCSTGIQARNTARCFDWVDNMGAVVSLVWACGVATAQTYTIHASAAATAPSTAKQPGTGQRCTDEVPLPLQCQAVCRVGSTSLFSNSLCIDVQQLQRALLESPDRLRL